jgi:hypothetical protein
MSLLSSLISKITVTGRLTGTIYQILVSSDPDVYSTVNRITANTGNLEPGMAINFFQSIGGLTTDTDYYILSTGFTSTYFSVSLTPGGSAVTLSDTSQIVTFIASRVVTNGTGTALLFSTDTTLPAQLDYTENVQKIELYLGRIADALETSDSTRLADNLQKYVEAGTGDGEGIRNMNVYDWVLLASMYKLYVDDDTDYKIGLDELVSYISKIRDLPKL